MASYQARLYPIAAALTALERARVTGDDLRTADLERNLYSEIVMHFPEARDDQGVYHSILIDAAQVAIRDLIARYEKN